jgi:hypothetical protein
VFLGTEQNKTKGITTQVKGNEWIRAYLIQRIFKGIV